MDTVVVGARMATSGEVTAPGWLAIRDGRIASLGVGSDPPPAARRIDATGQVILPGLVDCEHHPAHPLVETLVSETRAALASGITTLGIMGTSNRMVAAPPTIASPEDVPPQLEACGQFIKLAEERSAADFFLIPTLTVPRHFTEIRELGDRYGIRAFKAYLHLMTGEHIWEMWWPHVKTRADFYYDDGDLYGAMLDIAALDPPGVLCLHCENWEIARSLKRRLVAAGREDVAAYAEFSPPFTEAGHVRTYSYYARLAGCPIFVVHVTTPETIAEVLRARAEGARITANIEPHYLLLPPEYGSINVPLRDPATRPAVWEALRDDVINTISSDSLWRQTRPLEDVDEYGLRSTRKDAWGESFFNGSNGFVLPVMLSEGVHRGMLSLPRLVQACAETPARVFGLYPRKGTIAPGADADLVLVDLDLVRTVDRRMVTSRGAWSVWEGATLRGWPTMVLLRGTVAMEWPAQAAAPAFKGDTRGTYVAPVR